MNADFRVANMMAGAAADDEMVHETVRNTPSATKLGVVDGEAVVRAIGSANDSARGAGSDGGGGHARDVYCDGPLLAAVQNAGLFPDSKTFVDMPMNKDPADVLDAFSALSEADQNDPAKLMRFVEEHFDQAGSDIIPQEPSDFVPDPPFLASIEDEAKRNWAKGIHNLWPMLVRKVVEDVAVHPERHSLLPRKHPVVVPGGRFRESYYWDTFWTIRGLLVSGMVDTAKGAVLNLLDDTERFGFVPNGGRIYYTERSQPPLLSDMVCEIYSARPDPSFLARALPSLELEHAFWMDFERGRAVCAPAPPPPPTPGTPRAQAQFDGGVVLLNRYWGCLEPPRGPGEVTTGGRAVGRPLPSRRPRPESYRTDMDAARGKCACGGAAAAVVDGAGAETNEGVGIGPKGACHELSAAAESGWDFSSRWRSATPDSRATTANGRRRRASKAPGLRVPAGEVGAVVGERAMMVSEGDVSSKAEVEGDGDGEKHTFCLCETSTTAVVPADLNAFMHRMELNIARLHHAHHIASVCSRSSSYSPTGRSAFPSGNDQRTSASISGSSGRTPGEPERVPLGAHRTGTIPTDEPETETETATAHASRFSSTSTTASAAPALLTLDEIQRRFLSSDRRTYGFSSGSVVLDCLSPELTTGGGGGGGGGGGAERTQRHTNDGDDGGTRLGIDVRVVEEGRALCQKAMLLLAAANARAKAMEETMWDDSSGLWRDLLLPTGEQSPYITPACYVPLWAGVPWPRLEGAKESAGARLARSVASLRNSGLVQPAGVCTSLEDSGQQWDGRNAWPPLQWLLIQGLRRSADAAARAASPSTGESKEADGVVAARELAAQLEESFLKAAMTGWGRSGAMMEKYDAKETGKGGGGGEYDLQIGFGWTNGVALDLMAGTSKQ